MQAVLWDMDGLLVDSEPLWTVAERELAQRLGGTWSDEIKARVVGTRLDVAVPTVLVHFGLAPTPDRVARTSGWLLDRVAQLFAAGSLPLLPGAAALLESLAAREVPQALVSSSYRVLVDAVLAHGVGPFAVTVAGDEVHQGKPHPEPYLTAARRLGVHPHDCVVLEDSPSGVASGQAAGCAVVAVPSVPSVAFAPEPRRLVRASLEGLDVRQLRDLVAS